MSPSVWTNRSRSVVRAMDRSSRTIGFWEEGAPGFMTRTPGSGTSRWARSFLAVTWPAQRTRAKGRGAMGAWGRDRLSRDRRDDGRPGQDERPLAAGMPPERSPPRREPREEPAGEEGPVPGPDGEDGLPPAGYGPDPD